MPSLVHFRSIIDVSLFKQGDGWVFIGVPHGHGIYDEVLFSGKRRRLEDAMASAKRLAGEDVGLVYSMLDNNCYDWIF